MGLPSDFIEPCFPTFIGHSNFKYHARTYNELYHPFTAHRASHTHKLLPVLRRVGIPCATPTPRPGTILSISCFKCHTVITHAFYPSQIPSNYTSQFKGTASRMNGSSSPPSLGARKGGRSEHKRSRSRPDTMTSWDRCGCYNR
ncbi:hypothetical protein A0H81_07039 [Grifola frondosa]|uniref:Uncharacterized protein n=1 Tax=Grifola frondosa TaxID=5627 RepID=A0A1C7M9N0_GRIFR|nr:hypothetical protein A0H81_07039 [Grifola frondosa]